MSKRNDLPSPPATCGDCPNPHSVIGYPSTTADELCFVRNKSYEANRTSASSSRPFFLPPVRPAFWPPCFKPERLTGRPQQEAAQWAAFLLTRICTHPLKMSPELYFSRWFQEIVLLFLAFERTTKLGRAKADRERVLQGRKCLAPDPTGKSNSTRICSICVEFRRRLLLSAAEFTFAKTLVSPNGSNRSPRPALLV
jgi:hypothetical protein